MSVEIPRWLFSLDYVVAFFSPKILGNVVLKYDSV